MSSITLRQTPTPEIVERFKHIVDIPQLIPELKTRFQVLDKTHEEQWSKAWILGSIALAGLAVFAYTQARPYIAATLGILALGSALKTRVVVEIPAYTKQREEINKFFEGVASELRTAWNAASTSIAAVINNKPYTSVETADTETPTLLEAYIRVGEKDDFFIPAVWRASFRELYPIAEEFLKQKKCLETGTDLHPLVQQELWTIFFESARLVRGSSSENPNQAYVKNTIVGKKSEAKVISRPWAVLV